MNDWLDRTTLLLGKERVKELNACHILVTGLGGVGSYAAEMLCRGGIGKLTIIDADTVHPSNINRQLPALHSTIGKSKAEVMGQRLKDINPHLQLTVLNEFLKDERTEEILDNGNFDFVVDAIDSVSPKVYLIFHALKRKIPVVSALGAGGKKDISQIRLTDISKTYECALAKIIRKRLKKMGIGKGLPVVFSPEPVNKESIILVEGEQNKRSSAGTISYLPAVFGCYLAQYVLLHVRPANGKQIPAG